MILPQPNLVFEKEQGREEHSAMAFWGWGMESAPNAFTLYQYSYLPV